MDGKGGHGMDEQQTWMQQYSGQWPASHVGQHLQPGPALGNLQFGGFIAAVAEP